MANNSLNPTPLRGSLVCDAPRRRRGLAQALGGTVRNNRKLASDVRSSVILFVLGACLSQAALAQSMNAKGQTCADLVTTVEVASCFGARFNAADRDLNLLYARIKQVVEPNELSALNRAEHLWVRYRDATCNAERELYGRGTGGSPTYLACLAAETDARQQSLLRSYGWRLEKFGI